MKKLAKLAIVALTLALVMCLLPASPVHAEEERNYSIYSANIQVDLQEDGTANITETWFVFSKNDGFTQFCREIYTGAESNSLAGFDALTNVSVKIDGVTCQESDTDGYRAYQDEDLFVIAANKSHNEMTHTFEFSYSLTNIAKKTSPISSTFCHRFVDETHSASIHKLTLSIHFPVSGSVRMEKLTKGTYSFKDNTLVIRAEDCLGLYELQVVLNASMPFGEQYIPMPDSYRIILGLTIILTLIFISAIPVYFNWKNKREQKKEAAATES